MQSHSWFDDENDTQVDGDAACGANATIHVSPDGRTAYNAMLHVANVCVGVCVCACMCVCVCVCMCCGAQCGSRFVVSDMTAANGSEQVLPSECASPRCHHWFSASHLTAMHGCADCRLFSQIQVIKNKRSFVFFKKWGRVGSGGSYGWRPNHRSLR